jgi:hypothetical protein
VLTNPRDAAWAGRIFGALVVLAIVAGAGSAIATGGPGPFLLAAVAALSIVLLLPLATSRPFAATYLTVEAPIILLLLSTLVIRERDSTALANNPLDPAAGYRVACVTAALVLAFIALMSPTRAGSARPYPFGFKVFLVYVGVVFLGASSSVDPNLTTYRAFEVLAGVAAIAGAWRTGGVDAIRRIEQLFYWFFVVLIVTVWIGVALAPNKAVLPAHPFPFEIVGLYPHNSSNGVGEMGAFVLLWTLGRLVSPWNTMRTRTSIFLIAVGAVTLVAAQYRSGYIGVAVALVVLAIARGRKVLALIALPAAIVIGFFSFSTIVNQVQPYVLRGDSPEKAKQLSGRVYFWSKAIPVWRESPVLGRGLATATRFEVLEPLGLGKTSSIHGTWIEALVGTGVVGVTLLAVFLLSLWRHALFDLASPDGRVWPALLLTFITVKSITGSTFEVLGLTMLLLLCLVFTLPRRASSAAG